MRKTPTDIEILNAIYDNYYEEFASFTKEKPNRVSKIFVPLDIDKLAEQFKVDPDIVFGRLYYDLEKRYGSTNSDGTKSSFFTKLASGESCINFPYLASVLARLRDDKKKYRTSTGLAVLSLIISVVSLVLTLVF